MGSILSLQGLFRLARHVIADFVATVPRGVDPDFNWRMALPGVLRLPAAPQYWIHNETGFSHATAARYFAGLVGHLVSARASGNGGVPDMQKVLAQIEQQIGGLADGEAKLNMIAIYELWHRLLPEADHRDDSARVLGRHRGALASPTMVVEILAGEIPQWSVEQWTALADDRRNERSRERQRELPAQIDAALQAIAAESLIDEGRASEAVNCVAGAVEELPGNPTLLAWEQGIVIGHPIGLDVAALLYGTGGEEAADGAGSAPDFDGDDSSS